MANSVGVGEAKRRFSEIMSLVVYKGERFIIHRRGKAMATLISSEDLDLLEDRPVAPKGLLAAAGAWADFEDIDEVLEQIYRQREQAQDRSITLES